MKKIASILTISTTLIPLITNAECVPVPNCASIGYIETSCDGDSLKCPFDATKLKCIPCDSSYRYTCSGDNIKNSIGDACNAKYTSCECTTTDYIFHNGKCICDTSCAVGQIVYSDKTCSACAIEGKTPIAVVVYNDGNKRILAAVENPSVTWSAINNSDVEAIPNITTEEEVKLDMNGASYTLAIVNHFGTEGDITKNAALWCYNFEPYGFKGTKNQWYLPSMGELGSYLAPVRTAANNKLRTFGIEIARTGFSSNEKSATSPWNYVLDWGWLVAYQKIDKNNAICFYEWK